MGLRSRRRVPGFTGRGNEELGKANEEREALSEEKSDI